MQVVVDAALTGVVAMTDSQISKRGELRLMEEAGAIEPFPVRSWTFITNHAQVLLTVARHPEATVAEVARAAQITERSAYRMLADLRQAGYVRRRKVGGHNTYEIDPERPLGDPLLEDELVGDLVALVRKDWARDDSA
jgi:DNA-binding transcriptional ArsR family regulator